jgi:hypothetical protein
MDSRICQTLPASPAKPGGLPEALAAHDRALAAKIAAAVYTLCWDPNRRLLADTPERKTFSQHGNILGILTDSIPPADQQRVMKVVLAD